LKRHVSGALRQWWQGECQKSGNGFPLGRRQAAREVP